MRRLLRFALALGALALLAAAFAGRPDASALVPDEVVGVYKLKLKGDGWIRGTTQPYRVERIAGNATLFVVRAPSNDGKLRVEVRLDSDLAGGLLDLATPATAFVGEGWLVGESLAVIDTGAPTYVNAMNLQFLKEGDRVAGHWMSTYPAADAAATASAVGVTLSGRRLGKKVSERPAR